MICAMSGNNWSSGLEEDFKETPMHLCDYLTFEKDLALYLNRFELSLPK
jgi:hypothetical protein